jgi:hypothetical protein
MPWQLEEEIRLVTFSAYPEHYDKLRAIGIDPQADVAGIIWDSKLDEFYYASSGTAFRQTQSSILGRTILESDNVLGRNNGQPGPGAFMGCAFTRCLDKIPDRVIREAIDNQEWGRFHVFEWDLRTSQSGLQAGQQWGFGRIVSHPSCLNCQQIIDHSNYGNGNIFVLWMGRE